MANVSYKTIYEKAKIIKNKAEKEHKVAGTKWSYYICKSLLNPRKDIKNIGKFDYATNPRGNAFDDVKIYKKDYLDCAKRIVAYVEKYKRVPDACKWGDKRIRTRDFTYNMAKILIYYYTHQSTYPDYNVINTKVWNKPNIKKYGHARNSGCDNRGQNNSYCCGCHSLQEVFRNLTNIVVPQSTLMEVCGTTYDGTDHDGLDTGVAWFNRKYNKNLTVQWYNFSDLGWSGIKKIVNSSNQDCIIHNLYRNQWGHYEVINKVYDDYCDVQNSLGDYCDYGCYCGYVEERYLSTYRSYISGISQKSIMVITNKG